MSAEIPTSSVDKPITRSRAVNKNRRQLLLFAALTVILTALTVWGGRILLRNSETLVFATGDLNSTEARFANKLAAMLKSNGSRLRLKIVPNTDNGKAVAQFDRKQADLAILRTDAKIPARARAIAILEHDVLLLLSPKNKKVKSLAALKKLKVAVMNDGDAGAAFVRNILELPEGDAKVQIAPPGSAMEVPSIW